MKFSKGFRKVWLGLIFLATLTLVYAFGVEHNATTFATFAENWKWLGGVLFAMITAERSKLMHPETKPEGT